MFSEKILEDMLFEALENRDLAFLEERGLSDIPPYTHIERQLSFGAYGIPDMVSVIAQTDGAYMATVFELKVTPFCASHLTQLKRYITGIDEFYRKSPNIEFIAINGILICAEGDIKGDDVFLLNFLGYNIQVYVYSFDLKLGISFREISSSHSHWVRADSKLDNFSGVEKMLQDAQILRKELVVVDEEVVSINPSLPF